MNVEPHQEVVDYELTHNTHTDGSPRIPCLQVSLPRVKSNSDKTAKLNLYFGAQFLILRLNHYKCRMA